MTAVTGAIVGSGVYCGLVIAWQWWLAGLGVIGDGAPSLASMALSCVLAGAAVLGVDYWLRSRSGAALGVELGVAILIGLGLLYTAFESLMAADWIAGVVTDSPIAAVGSVGQLGLVTPGVWMLMGLLAGRRLAASRHG